MTLDYPHTPGSKEKGGCSEEAAFAIDKSGKAAMLRRKCLQILSDHSLGKTADELAEDIGEDVLSIRPRMTELFKTGRAFKTNMKRRNRKGNVMAVAVITDAGRAALQAMEK